MNALMQKKLSLSPYFLMLADLFKPPDEELWEDISNGRYFEKLQELATDLHGTPGDWDIDLSNHPKDFQEFKFIYYNTLGGIGNAGVLPVESLYKPWTLDSTCEMPFARNKGYLLGDSAFHIRYLLEQFDMKVPTEYGSIPDHLAILLELLSFFIKKAPDDFTNQFIEEHFDWLDDFAEKLEEIPEHPFYLSLIGLLNECLLKYFMVIDVAK